MKISAPSIFLAALIILGLFSRKSWANIPVSALQYLPLFYEAERDNNIPHTLLVRVAWIESRFDPNAYNSKSNAQGMMQIVPEHHPDVNPFNVSQAVPYAAKYLRQMFERFNSWPKAIAAYNYGPTNVNRLIEKHGYQWEKFLPSETQNYLKQMREAVSL